MYAWHKYKIIWDIPSAENRIILLKVMTEAISETTEREFSMNKNGKEYVGLRG